MLIGWLQATAVFAAAFAAGMINSVAGGGTLVTFPTLIWLGLDAIVANVTNTVSLWPGALGAMFGLRREIGDGWRWMMLLAGPSILGGLVGAVLLLHTPPAAFGAMVPFLILFATVLLAVQEPISRWLRGETHPEHQKSRSWWIAAVLIQFLIAVYGGYFGAGIGILMLAGLGLLGLTDIHQMNGLKSFFNVCINIVAAVYFMFWGPVAWGTAAIMVAGALAGGYGGAGLARRLGRTVVRRAVIAVGFAMALSLLLRR